MKHRLAVIAFFAALAVTRVIAGARAVVLGRCAV